MRLPYAAKQLIAQVQSKNAEADVEVEPFGELDGFGVARTIRFSGGPAAWLAPLLDVLDDKRIASTDLTEAGYLHVTFVNTPQADRRDPFSLDAAELMNTMEAEQTTPVVEPEPEKPAAKKAPAKRAAKKAASK